jgi:pimeloyl-ACP methyl ester carboxylesterase
MPFFTNDDVQLFYTSDGPSSSPRPPLLLLHGWACDSHDFSHQIPYLVSLNLHVVALDHRGHGRSSTPSSVTNYTMYTLADDVLALLKHLRISSVIIVAHSMSTIIASILAVQNPEVVKALVLLQPIYCGVPTISDMVKTMQGNAEVAPALTAKFFAGFMYTPRTPNWLKTWHIRRVLGTDPIALSGCLEGIVDLFGTVVGQSDETRSFMQRRKAPRLIMCTSSLPAAEEWENEVGLEKGVDRLEMLDEGTFSHIVVSERVNEILGEWLGELRC